MLPDNPRRKGKIIGGRAPTSDEVYAASRGTDPKTGAINAEKLGRHVNLAQKIVEDKPDEAVLALRQMLQATPEEAAA